MASSFMLTRRGTNWLVIILVLILLWNFLGYTNPTDRSGWPRNLFGPPKPTGPLINSKGHFAWSKLPERYPVSSYAPLPTNPGRARIPKIQADNYPFKFPTDLQKQRHRLAAVKGNFTHAWNGYRMKAWGKDEVKPLSGKWENPFGGWGATLVDALGTLWIMGMEAEFDQAVGAATQIDFSSCALEELNVFETTIRYLGGFLSAYDLSKGKYTTLLDKAVELGEMLYHAFDTPNRMPITRWNWQKAQRGEKQTASDFMLVAELGSLTLEFTRLGQLTGDPKYYDAIKRVMDIFEHQQMKTYVPGLWPVVVDAKNLDLIAHTGFTLGGMADSTFEYLPKQHLLLNGGIENYQKMYEQALKPMKEHMFYRPMTPDHHDMLLPGQLETDSAEPLEPEPQAQHLACFAGGMVGLGAKLFSSDEDLKVATKLVEGCLWAYESSTLGIMPEIMHTVPCPSKADCEWDEALWHEKLVKAHGDMRGSEAEEIIQIRHLAPGVKKIDDGRYILRPEAIESVFYLYRLTGDPSLQDRAWEMFQNIVKHTTTPIAHAALDDCTVPGAPKADKMESFWLAETLRYFYLIFADEELVSLDDWVFNTEAHPLKRPP